MTTWRDLPEWTDPIGADEQVLLVAATGGAKSTLAATMTLPVRSLVVVDDKAAMTLPTSRTVELPAFGAADPATYDRALRAALRHREDVTNRVILRPHVLDVESFEAHDAIFHAVYERRATILWIDEITATGATANRCQPWLRGISARGRTRGLGLWTCTQAPFGVTPPILRRNASVMIFGPLDPDDVGDIRRPGIEIAETIPRKSGRFIVYRAGTRDPYRLYVPIPPQLRGWTAP